MKGRVTSSRVTSAVNIHRQVKVDFGRLKRRVDLSNLQVCYELTDDVNKETHVTPASVGL